MLLIGVLKLSRIIVQGKNEFDVTQYINEGANYITISIINNNSSTINFDYIINGVKLTLTSSFNPTLVYTENIAYRYIVAGNDTKDIVFALDGNIIDTVTTKTSGIEATYTIKDSTHGTHSFEVYAKTTLGRIEITSNV